MSEFEIGDRVGFIHSPFVGEGVIVGIIGITRTCHIEQAAVQIEGRKRLMLIRMDHLKEVPNEQRNVPECQPLPADDCGSDSER